MPRRLHHYLLLAALLLATQLVQVSHWHADGLPNHNDCVACQLHADHQAPLPVVAPALSPAVTHTAFLAEYRLGPALARPATRNRGPPALA